MIVKALILFAIPLAIALSATGYARYLWHADQERWAAAREAAELRYAQEVESKCRLGEINDDARCAKALAYITTPIASTD